MKTLSQTLISCEYSCLDEDPVSDPDVLWGTGTCIDEDPDPDLLWGTYLDEDPVPDPDLLWGTYLDEDSVPDPDLAPLRNDGHGCVELGSHVGHIHLGE